MSVDLFALHQLKQFGIDNVREPILSCCDQTLDLISIFKKIKGSDDFKGLLELSENEFQIWQNFQIGGSFHRSKVNNKGCVTCQGCQGEIKSHGEAFAKGGQYFHRGACSTEFWEQGTERTIDYYERMYWKRLATGINSDIEFIEDLGIEDRTAYVLFPGGETHLYVGEHGDFRIWIEGRAYIECIENDEISVFFRCLRYCLENDMSISDIYQKLEDHFGNTFFGVNTLPIEGYEVFIENSFINDEYNHANHSYNHDITDYDLCDGNDVAIARMIGILRLSQGMRKASIIEGLRKLKEGEFLDLLNS